MPRVAKGEVAENAPMSAEARRWWPPGAMVRDVGGRSVEPDRDELDASGVLLRFPMMLDMVIMRVYSYSDEVCNDCLFFVVGYCLCGRGLCGMAHSIVGEVTCRPAVLKGIRQSGGGRRWEREKWWIFSSRWCCLVWCSKFARSRSRR